MDNIRLILFMALGFVLLLIWQAWQEDYGNPSSPVDGGAVAETLAKPGAAPGNEASAVPIAPMKFEESRGEGDYVPEGAMAEAAETLSVKTDTFRAEISLRGGDILEVYLQDYPVSVEKPEIKFQLMGSEFPNIFIAQSGLISGDKEKAPTHETFYTVEQSEFVMEEGQETLEVPLVWKHPSGIEVVKRYRFHRGSYLIDLSHEVRNGSGESWTGREYRQFQRSDPTRGETHLLPTYTGAAIYSQTDKYKKISFDDMDEKKLDQSVTGGWFAMIQHYFVGAWVPPAEEQEKLYSKNLSGGRYMVGMYSPLISVADGTTHRFESRLFIGPKLQQEMAATAPGLELTVDYGWLTVLAQPIYWLLEKIHSLLGNWGWSIVVLTLLIKLAFFKLSETSYKSMANMRKLAPRMQALKDRYGDDKQRMNQAVMEMYKKEKINPLGGCLPILVQIPVFIALYFVLLESVELRQAPFILWLEDLSIKDPFFVLPIIMGVSMFLQQKLNPAPLDPMQAKVMMALPFIFTVFFAFFPAGLVLYWVVNNILSIAQQWYITRNIEQGAK